MTAHKAFFEQLVRINEAWLAGAMEAISGRNAKLKWSEHPEEYRVLADQLSEPSVQAATQAFVERQLDLRGRRQLELRVESPWVSVS